MCDMNGEDWNIFVVKFWLSFFGVIVCCNMGVRVLELWDVLMEDFIFVDEIGLEDFYK